MSIGEKIGEKISKEIISHYHKRYKYRPRESSVEKKKRLASRRCLVVEYDVGKICPTGLWGRIKSFICTR